ncbi:MAG: HEAT repeat domain-containing protein [Pirellulales bacterium]|nr:HEAT repeat domain-containing protein [Pirellulales bacterium]
MFRLPPLSAWKPRAACAAALISGVVWLLAAASIAQAEVELVASTDPLTAQQQQAKFHLPPGFEIQLVAAEPEIRKPINLNFDAQGRLYATESVEYPFPAKDGAPHRDVIKIFDRLGPDGRAGSVTTFAEELNIPIGVLPVKGGVLAYSIPNISFFPDANGDDRADERRPYYGTFGFVDTHGMGSSFRRWIDGWIYGCHGFANNSEIAGADGQPVVMHSGNTYRLREDGSHIEYFTHGQVNPFGLAFDPLGNMYSSDCHTLPVYMLLRGAWYPSFGKPHDGLGFGPEMIGHLHNSTGIAGVVYYTADHFPPEFRDTILIGNPVTGRINHDRLEQHGSTYKAVELPDFISCDDPWFRPVDLQMGPDGALYIADFYNRIIGHYEVPITHPGRDRERGRIWRVVYKGEQGNVPAPRAMPNLKQIAAAEPLVALLADENLTVRTLATNELADRWTELAPADLVLKTVVESKNAPQRAHALWLLERQGLLDDALVERLAGDEDRLVRVHLLRALAERPEWSSAPLDIRALVVARLQDDDPFARRVAADALDRHPRADQLAPLLELWRATPGDDTHLVHVVRMALRDHLLQEGMYAEAEKLAAATPDNDTKLADVSLGVHNAQSAAFLTDHLARTNPTTAQVELYLHHVLRFADDDRLAEAFQLAERFRERSPAEQFEIVRAVQRATQERALMLPANVSEWGVQLAGELYTTGEHDRVRDCLDLAREMRLTSSREAVLAVLAANSTFADLRPAAMEALVAIDAPGSVAVLAGMVGDPADAMEMRQRAAEVLANLNSEETRALLVAALATAPERLAARIAAGLAGSALGAEELLAAVAAGKASPRVLRERDVDARLHASKIENLAARLAELTADLPADDERIVQLIAARRQGYETAPGDIERGRAVFTKICAGCHRIGGAGAKIGPELDGIGQRGVERLLEDVLDPSRNVDQAFRSTQIATTGGQVLSGLVLREEGSVLVLADNQGKEVRVPLDEIDEREVSKLSPMPANVPDLVTEAEFYDLLSFLLSNRVQPEPTATKP